MSRTKQEGFSLVEMLIVIAVLAVMLAAVWNTSSMVSSTVESNSRSAEVTSKVRRTLQQIGKFLRPAKMSTVGVQAVSADVTAGLAASVGEWIDPTDLVWRPGIRFQSASGEKAMNAALSTSPRSLTFSLESGESANSLDDDGDGLIDEGVVKLLHDSVTVAVVRDVESCEFWMDGRTIRVRLQCGRSSPQGRVHRTRLEQSFYLRNN